MGASTVGNISGRLEQEPLRSEYLNLEKTEDQVKTASHFPNVPLKVISRGEQSTFESSKAFSEWFELQKELATLSAQGEHIISEKTSEEILGNDPDLVIRSIEDMVKRVRTGKPVHNSFSTVSTNFPDSTLSIPESDGL